MANDRHPRLKLGPRLPSQGVVLWCSLLIAACGPPAEERCAPLAYAQATAPWVRAQRAEVRSDVEGWATRIGEDSLRRWVDSVGRMRMAFPDGVEDYELAAEFYVDTRKDTVAYGRATSDSAMAVKYVLHFLHPDSLPALPLPPTPSELAWYAEHCDQGKAR